MAEYGAPYIRDGEIAYVNGFPRYPDDEMQRRFRFVADLCESAELDVVIVGGATGPLETSVQFFSNWPSQVQSYVVFTPSEPPALFVRLWNHLPDAERISMIEDVRYGGDTPADQADQIGEWIAARNASRVGLIGVVPHDDHAMLRRRNPTVDFVDMNPAYREFRLVKSDDEMVFVDVASRMNDAAIDALAATLAPGMSERETASIVEDVYLAHGGWNLIHFSLSTPMSDPQVCVPHQYHPDRVLRAGDVFVTEISTTFWGYAGQILRTFTIDSEPTPRYRALHDTASAVYQSIVDILRSGTTIGEVLDRTDQITTAGFDIWDDLVHGFGGAYLPPIVRTRASRGATHPDGFAYPDGALVVVQPNVIDGSAGVQVGNSMRITDDGVEITQSYPTELIVC